MSAPVDFSKPIVLHKSSAFWRIHLDKQLVTTFRGTGEGKTGGRRYTKKFRTQALAEAWATESVNARKSEGYTEHSAVTGASVTEAGSKNDNAVPSSSNTGLRRSSRKRAPPSSFTPGSSSPNHPPSSPSASVSSKRKSSNRARSSTKSSTPAQSVTSDSPPAESSSSNASQSPVKKVKRSMSGKTPVDTSQRLGVVDPASGLPGTILTQHIGSTASGQTVVYDVMLVLIDVAKNHDKFILIQLIDAPEENKYYFFERWGRTGTPGQSLTLEYSRDQLDLALRKFESLFQQKTGLTWETAETGDPILGKYRFVRQDYVRKTRSANNPGLWQYWVDDGVDGKETGWYDYDEDGNNLVEQLYLEYNSNTSWLSRRIVKSGFYSYLVDLSNMTQTNIEHPARKVRLIRRIPPHHKAMDSKEEDGDVRMEAKDDNEPQAKDKPKSDTDTKESKSKVTAKQEQTTETPVGNGGSARTVKGRAKKPISPTPAAAKPQHKVEPVQSAKVPSVAKKSEAQMAKVKEEKKEEETAVDIEISVDSHCPSAANFKVVGDRDATMNQTNIMGNNNNNKYYRMQLLEENVTGAFRVWTRWGRVGEVQGAQVKMMGPFTTIELAEKMFNKKFREKAGYHWIDRATKDPVPGKYELLKIDHSAEPEQVSIGQDGKAKVYAPSKLDRATKELVELLFEENLYLDALKEFDIDVRRMPLGKLTTEQIEKGVTVLKEIENKLQQGSNSSEDAEYQRLSSRFYTALPHDFGRQRPPIINTQDRLQKCFDMCNVLRDVEKAKDMMNDASTRDGSDESTKARAKVDVQYDQLKADMRLLEEGSDELNIVRRAFEETKGLTHVTLLNAWRVERQGEKMRFQQIKSEQDLDNHMLLWHGSHIGSISAILANGLRIMPHSGGRCGRGIYLATENNKSLGYTRPAWQQQIGCMFLAEAALGRVHDIIEDQYDLVSAPKGFHSVRARGRQSPPKLEQILLDEVSVQVPISKPVEQQQYLKSSFTQDEVIVYREQQVRIRYVLSVRF